MAKCRIHITACQARGSLDQGGFLPGPGHRSLRALGEVRSGHAVARRAVGREGLIPSSCRGDHGSGRHPALAGSPPVTESGPQCAARARARCGATGSGRTPTRSPRARGPRRSCASSSRRAGRRPPRPPAVRASPSAPPYRESTTRTMAARGRAAEERGAGRSSPRRRRSRARVRDAKAARACRPARSSHIGRRPLVRFDDRQPDDHHAHVGLRMRRQQDAECGGPPHADGSGRRESDEVTAPVSGPIEILAEPCGVSFIQELQSGERCSPPGSARAERRRSRCIQGAARRQCQADKVILLSCGAGSQQNL